ncbi:MAG: 30S ribosomal protein S6 [Desulfobacterales bacterium]|nr:30S ribosomal protein S6 [Desulfobacterales bacterium]
MRRYETIFIIRPNAGEEEITAMIDKVTAIIGNDGGTVIKIDKWGLKKLAYLIKKESQGYYVYLDFAGLPTTVTEIERILKIDDRSLKYMTVKLADSCDPEALAADAATGDAAESSEAGEKVEGETEKTA